MSIDARIETVVINEDGSGELRLIDRPKRRPGDYPGCRGQGALFFEVAPEEVTGLNGCDVWGSASNLMLGDREIATRTTYTKIRFVDRSEFIKALDEYFARK